MSRPRRFAIYARYSSELQNELSLADQLRVCRGEVARRGGQVVATFEDEAEHGWSLARPGFQALRRAAARGRFDALVLWKFDRLARDRSDVVIVKSLLRKEYGLKLYCVQGASADDDDTGIGALVEQVLEVIAAFYSRNLSTDTKRGKRARAERGEFNGSIAPLGYRFAEVPIEEEAPDGP